MNIYVTKPFLPPKEKFLEYVNEIFDKDLLTNQGPFLLKLEKKLKSFLKVKHLHFVTNGTLALQLAIRALDLDGEIITTPFSYVATISSILWERCTPVFVDIEPNNFTIDPHKIEQAITSKTKAIMPVHTFGYSCDIDSIETIAKKHHLKVIYDAAHAFASEYKGRALASYGDISVLSFHATKLFHTIEGGACVIKDSKISNKIEFMKRYGHHGDEHFMLGINAKQDEFNAAMGLANIEYIQHILEERKRLSDYYDSLLKTKLERPKIQQNTQYNYAYYPILFESENELLNAFRRLNAHQIYPRRYFYPCLNRLPYLKTTASCPIAENIASRIACLPLFVGLQESIIQRICQNL